MIVDWLGEFLALMAVWYFVIMIAYVLGLMVIGGITWPFRRLPDTSSWHIKDEGFQFRFGVVICAIALGLAILQMRGAVYTNLPEAVPMWDQ